MSWGADGPYPIPDGTTWDSVATGAEWTAHSSGSPGLTWGGFNIEFHVYTAGWTGAAWSAWGEITGAGRPVQAFNTKRGVRDWWLGMQPGTATIELDYTGGETSYNFNLVQKVRLTVDVPAGEKDLFTGFCIDTQKTFNAAGYPVIRLQLVDHVGWSAQQVHPATPYGAGPHTSGALLRGLVRDYGAGIETADYNSVSGALGLNNNGTWPAGNLLDKLNVLLRGELGVMWVDAAGVFQFSPRGWWYPLGNPVATIGSLDRGAGGTRNDPALTEAGWKFPATIGRFGAKVTYTSFTWTGSGIGPSTAASTTGGIGTRQWTDTNFLTVAGDLTTGLNTLSVVLPNFPAIKGLFDDSAALLIHTEHSFNALNYCAVADVTDFVEVAKETQIDVDGRWWVPGHVMGVSHSFTPGSGWDTTLDLDLGLAEADHDPDEG